MFSTPLTMFNVPRIGVHSQLKKRVIELENAVKKLEDENLRLELRNEKLYEEFNVHPWGLYIFFLLLTVIIVMTAVYYPSVVGLGVLFVSSCFLPPLPEAVESKEQPDYD